MKLLVTGGAGFIGSAVIRHVLAHTSDAIVNVDKLTYAGCLDNIGEHAASPSYWFEQVDICDRIRLREVFQAHQPDAVMHLAAETHVDRSIDGPAPFIQTNLIGTFTLLEVALEYWRALPADRSNAFRFLHVSTDEVYGELALDTSPLTEAAPYAPNSPYAASKASADHFARAWRRTYGLPVCVSNCSNNYGPYQFPEKLIPLTIRNALEGQPLAVYGRGEQIRDWLFVEDHARALHSIVTRAKPGAMYNIGASCERRNIDVVLALCALLDELAPERPAGGHRYQDLIRFVADRPGHDLRYALDSGAIRSEIGWAPLVDFESGLRETVRWYIENRAWCQKVLAGTYTGQRLGTR